MKITEKELDYLESHIPEMASAATKQAYWQALASGSSVLISQNGFIVEISPDGTTRMIEKSPPFVEVGPHKIIELK
jgi:hypothetical protein